MMRYYWIFVALFAAALGSVAAQNQEEYWDYDDAWWSNEAGDGDLGIVASKENNDKSASINDDYEIAEAESLDLNEDKLLDVEKVDNLEKSDEADDNFDDALTSNENRNAPDSDQIDKVVEEEIEQFQKDIDDPASFIADEELTADDTFSHEQLKNDSEETLDSLKNNEYENDDKFDDYEPANDTSISENDASQQKYALKNEENIAEKLDKSEESKKERIESDGTNFDDYQVEDNRSVEFVKENAEDNQQIDPKLTEETKQILRENDDDFEADPIEQVNKEGTVLSKIEGQINNNDNLDKQKEKNNEFDDIDKYMREAASDLENGKVEDDPEDKIGAEIAEYDKEYAETQSNEDTVDKVYADLKVDLDKLFETWNKLNDDFSDEVNIEEYEKKYGKPYGEDVVLSQRDDFENYDDNVAEIDSNLGDIFNDTHVDEQKGFNDKLDDEQKEDIENILPIESTTSKIPDKQPYNNDIIIANQTKNPDTAYYENEERITSKRINDFDYPPGKTINVEDLAPTEYNDLMSQFIASHKDELDTHGEDLGQIAPIHITLSTDEVKEITSPNWPSPYPTNNAIDWILEGEGNGIELNLTDLSVRGALGDYLLIKPGVVDETDHEALVFSFQLNEPRNFRFTDVNQVFVRFVSGMGWGTQPGFRLTAKLIWPLLEEEELPEPEAVSPPLPGIYTVYLGGVSAMEFFDKKEDFRQLIADMALMHINANNMEMGENSTSDTTQIVAFGLCNINWPNYESCVEVAFGVPLVHDDSPPTRLNDTDLRTMWETYVNRDPFAARLRAMGITEFAIPNDDRILTLWTILAVGIVICAVLLALSLWRYSCFENYTRMKTYSDTDSIRDEKRGLDLYPTPHQTLPPLYSDADYSWADAKYEDTARVDMGGITNTGYIRDELLNMDSDEEVVDPRERDSGYTVRNVYEV